MSNEQSSNVIAFGGNTMVYESTKRFALRGLNDLIRVLMENVDDALFTLSEKVENDHERTMYFEAMRELRLKRQSIIEKFDHELQNSFADLIHNKSSREIDEDNLELSLVEQSEIEDKIAIDNMISKARPHFENDLFAVVERLKVVLHRKTIDENLNPLDPKSICESFHIASEELETDIQVKLIFYKLFDKYVMSNLGSFYHELNNFFIQKGILPEFKAEQERLSRTTKYMANKLNRSSSSYDSQNDAEKELNIADLASSGSIAHPQQSVDGNLLSMLQQILMPSSGMPQGLGQAGSVSQQQPTGVPGSGAPMSLAMNSHYMGALTSLQSAPMITQPVMSVDPQQLKSELQQQLVTIKQENHHLGTETDNQIIDIVSMLFDFFFDDEALPDPIKVLIGRLQIPILKVAILDNSFFNHKKHPARKLLDSISKASMGWSSDQAKEQILIEKIEKIVNLLLQEFEDDISVFDKALQEFQLFLDQESDSASKAQGDINAQEQQKEHTIKVAHLAVDSMIDKVLKGKDLSFPVTEFIQSQWKTVLFNIYLSQGAASNHWKNLRKITSTLVWTLIAKDNEEDKRKLLKTLPALLRALSKGMEFVQIEVTDQNAVFQMLVVEHAKVMKQTTQNIVTRVDDNTVWPEETMQKNMDEALAGFKENQQDNEIDFLFETDATGEIQVIESVSQLEEVDMVQDITQSSLQDVIHDMDEFTQGVKEGAIQLEPELILDSMPLNPMHAFDHDDSDLEEAEGLLEKIQAMEIGSWVEFRLPDENNLNAKLSWKSNVTGKYVFVNRHGQKVRNMTMQGMVAELGAGTVRLIESVSVFDRAINSLVSGLNH